MGRRETFDRLRPLRPQPNGLKLTDVAANVVHERLAADAVLQRSDSGDRSEG